MVPPPRGRTVMSIHKKDFTVRLRIVLKRSLIVLAVTALVAVSLAGAGWLLRYRILAVYLGISQPVYSKMVVEKDVMVPMRDGVRLATDIYRPDGTGPFPAVMIRLPYDKKPLQEVMVGRFSFSPGILFAQRGLVLIIQDVRGRYASEGDFYAFSHERQDSEDVVRWLREQPWFNGDLGAVGPSYLGYTQWALAPAAGDTLKCMAPMVISADLRDLFYRNGAVCLDTGGGWAVGVGEREDGDHPKKDFETGMWHLPLMEADDVTGADVDFFNDWLAHPQRDAYWEALDRRPEIPNITAPSLLIGGWYDIAAGGMLEDYQALRASAGSDAARQPHLLMGPWMHGSQECDRDFGTEADVPLLFREMFDWNDYWLRGKGSLPDKPVHIFVMGINTWRREEDWPLARTVYTPYYIRSDGKANTAAGDGVLSETSASEEEAPDTYAYDPADPVPSVGGCFMGDGMGPRRQEQVERRQDVLVYTSAPLTEALEVTGPIRFVLYAATSGDDTDFTAKLCDVAPDGTSLNLAEGIVRGRFREDGKDTPLVPGEVYRFEIDLWATSNVFLEGHRIRVQVSSSNFPQFDRNLNVYGPFAQQTEFKTAAQTIYHDAERPSHILLPVIPQ